MTKWLAAQDDKVAGGSGWKALRLSDVLHLLADADSAIPNARVGRVVRCHL